MNEIEAVGASISMASADNETPSPQTTERPWTFAFLVAPMAVLSNGVISGVLSYLLRQQGVGSARSASIISLLNLPQVIYFLWSPITDFWILRRTWLVLGAVASAALLVVAFHQPNLASPTAVTLIFLSACLCQLVVASCGGMLGTLHAEATRRRASSFYQSGSLAFGAVAIFVLASLAGKLSLGSLGWITAALVVLPSLMVFAAPRQDFIQTSGLSQTLTRVWTEFKATFFHWRAIPYTLLMTFPMASGAAIGLLPGLAVDYGVSGHQVAWMNGLAGALLTAAGAMAATLVPARVRASVAYLSAGLVNAATLAVLWLGPLRPSTYFVGATLYLFTIGACYALFTAVVLEFLGVSGKTGSSRYSIINSLGNVPVAYMILIDGKGYARWGARGLPATEAVLGAIGATVLLVYFLTRKHPTVQPA
jgi:PAT family beta-lactamase induction signal transducer AmpG